MTVSCGKKRHKSSSGNDRGNIEKIQEIKLFNGKDLSNWIFMLRDPTSHPDSVFTVKDGVIHISGDPFGYMRTTEEYSDYKLHAEWRYPSELSNSGIFIHAQIPDTIWPECFECQLQAGNAGDFICMNGSKMNEQENDSWIIKKTNPSNEKPLGEWNSMEVTCSSDKITVYVNGVFQNRATGISAVKGYICLQSEGKDIEFRNILITKLN